MNKSDDDWNLTLGAQPDTNGTKFRVWATNAQRVEVVLFPDEIDGAVTVRELKRDKDEYNYFRDHIRNIKPGTRYKYRLDGQNSFPDPASRYQPQGVHGPSQVVDTASFNWTDRDWRGITLEDLVIYELHVGTATPEGTFDALIDRLDHIRDLGVTAIELMPIADFSGDRNWGYDGVCLFAPARAYGPPEDLQRLVDAAHARNLAVILDVVYNHLGPDGNYLAKFSGEYFDDRYTTPWGPALNFSPYKKGRPVRQFFIANACYWAHEYHLDGIRVDAIQAMNIGEEPNILAELAASVRHSLPEDRSFLILAEDESNDSNLLKPRGKQGFDLDAVWADDFHHQVYVALTDDRRGYYIDYEGTAEDLAKTLNEGWFYTGQYSKWFKDKDGQPATRGTPARPAHPRCFIHHIENHDQAGNRPLGERLNHLTKAHLRTYRAASALLLISPYTPMLFMGQEWAASTPFLYFTDHDEELGRLVTEGRQRELEKYFPGFSKREWPKPQDPETFLSSKLRWEERNQALHAIIFHLYSDLIKLRRNLLTLYSRKRRWFEYQAVSKYTLVLRWTGESENDHLLMVVNLHGGSRVRFHEEGITAPPNGYIWNPRLDTEVFKYGGHGDTKVDGELLEMKGPGALLLVASLKPNTENEYTALLKPNTANKDAALLAPTMKKEWDIFISHASEDKDLIARPLYEALNEANLSVWFDEATLRLGDSLRRKIDDGLARCRFGIVILSPHFLEKDWPQRELEGLIAREVVTGEKTILPVWHHLDAKTLNRHSPTLTDRVAAKSENGVSAIVKAVLRVLEE